MDHKAFDAWQGVMKNRAKTLESQKNIDWGNTKVDPSKLSYEMGPALTEEQFKEYCQKTGIRPQIIKK